MSRVFGKYGFCENDEKEIKKRRVQLKIFIIGKWLFDKYSLSCSNMIS
jgi:hypothetical protein